MSVPQGLEQDGGDSGGLEGGLRDKKEKSGQLVLPLLSTSPYSHPAVSALPWNAVCPFLRHMYTLMHTPAYSLPPQPRDDMFSQWTASAPVTVTPTAVRQLATWHDFPMDAPKGE